jgi:hypothetical protein
MFNKSLRSFVFDSVISPYLSRQHNPTRLCFLLYFTRRWQPLRLNKMQCSFQVLENIQIVASFPWPQSYLYQVSALNSIETLSEMEC